MLTNLGHGDWIASLPNGIDAILDEGISGGQMQAVSVARVLLSNKPIVLLDEPFSAMDAEKAHLLLQELERQKHEKAILITSHKKFDDIRWDVSVKL